MKLQSQQLIDTDSTDFTVTCRTMKPNPCNPRNPCLKEVSPIIRLAVSWARGVAYMKLRFRAQGSQPRKLLSARNASIPSASSEESPSLMRPERLYSGVDIFRTHVGEPFSPIRTGFN